MTSRRLSPMPHEWIDRSKPISFCYEGSYYSGYAGDTVASALWASGQQVLGRSFKYHRPRGLLSFANHDINTLMQAGQQLNLRADVVPLEPEMDLTAINTFGGVKQDRASFLDLLAAFMPVGFYYKAFLDKQLFPKWERLIRYLTGLGRVDFDTPQLRTAKRYDFCDLLVIGGGLSGLSAALTAAAAGADVVIVDENQRLGGAALYQLGGELGSKSAEAIYELIDTVTQHPRIRVYSATEAAGYYADHWLPLVQRDYLIKMRAQAVVVASGAYEQPAVFRNNDRPGVMLASAAQRLIYRHAVQPMRRAVVLTANRDGYRAALDLQAAGVDVAAVVDLRQQPLTDSFTQAVRQSIPVYTGCMIYEAQTNPQGDGITAAMINTVGAAGAGASIACDGILMSVGWAPAANLLYQAGAKMQFDAALQQFVPQSLPAGLFACGRVNGVYGNKRADGERAGRAAAAYLGLVTAEVTQPDRSYPESPSHPWPIVPHPQGKNFVDFDEDLQLKDFYHAAQEGFDNIELLKRYTTVGMGPSQGKHSNMNALRILARIKGVSPDQIGTTTARPFFHPVPLSHLAGRGFRPERRTPMHQRHLALNAEWMQAGPWQRPEYYRQGNLDRASCIQREVEAVRTRVGLIDVGTLGKLEIRGPQAAEFLERVYTGRFANLKVGMTRYALMLDETGVIIDDGVVARLAPDYFYFTTTTAGAAAIYRELTRLNLIWQLDCGLVNLTGARTAVNLAGPLARQVLSPLSEAVTLPYLGAGIARVAGIEAIVLRVGFVGEWGYELHVAADQGITLWDTLIKAGIDYEIQPFGVEAQRLLRLEKGHLIVGQDTDGLTTPVEANLTWAVKSDKAFFVGQRSLQAMAQHMPKQKLVGFILDVDEAMPPQECHLIIEADEIAGRVTSIGFSPTLNRYIGLAYLKPQLALGHRFSIRRTDGSYVMATVSPTPFYDPQNLRQQLPQRQEVAV